MISTPSTQLDAFYAHLSQGLHAAAQPLTILRASLDRGLTDGMNVEQLRELTASSAMEVERVCGLFTSLQQLVMAESMLPELSSVPLVPLLTHILEELRPVFEKEGLCLRSQPLFECPPVLIHLERTRQALSSVLRVARLLAQRGDTIEVIASRSPGEVQVLVGNANVLSAMMPTELSLGLALAEAIIRNQRGRVRVSTQPFRVLLGFTETTIHE